MINKNQYKVRNVKKILHKVGKNWLVVSTALLGMVAGGAVAGTATHADTTPVNANHSNGYVNHQMTQSAGSASPQLVRSDGTSLASVSANSSVASNNVSPSASKSTVSSAVPSASSAVQLTRPQQRLLGQTPSAPKSVSLTPQQQDSKATYELDNVIDDMMSLNANSSFGLNVTSSAFNDFNVSPNASDFVKSFNSNCLTVSDGVGVVQDHFSILFNNPVISSAYQDLHTSEESANGRSILLQLLQTNPSNESSELTSTSSFISGNLSGFARNGDLPFWKSIASNVNGDKNNVSSFDNVIDSLVSSSNVSNAVNDLANETSAKRDHFKIFITHVESDFNSVRNKDMKSIGDAFNSFANKLLLDSYTPSSIKSVLIKLTSNDLEPVASRYFYNFTQYDHRLVHTLLSDLMVVTNDNYKGYLNALNKTIGAQISSSLHEYGMPTLGSNLQTIAADDLMKANTSKENNSTKSNGKATPSDNKSQSAKNVVPKSQNTNKQSSINTKGKKLTPNKSSSHKNNSNSDRSNNSLNNSVKNNKNSTQTSANSSIASSTTTNSNGVTSGGHHKSVPSAGTDHSAKPSDSVKPNGSSDDGNGKLSTNSNASYLTSLSNSKAEQSASLSKASRDSSISASESVASASAAASKSSEEKSLLNSIIDNAQFNNKDPQTSSPDDNNPGSPSAPNDNNTLDSSSNDDSNFASQSQFSFTNNASTSSSAVQSSASSSAKSNVSSASNVNQLSIGQQVDYHGMTVTRKRPTYRWFEISKTCLAHNTLDSVGKVKDYGAVLSPGMKVRLDKIFKVNVGHRTVYRYEININGHDYFVTGNHHFTNDAYYRASDFKGRRAHGRYGHRYFEAIVKKPFMVYDSSRFDKDNQLWKSRRGQLIDIKGVHKIGNVTRLALIDGTYITANREFLKLI